MQFNNMSVVLANGSSARLPETATSTIADFPPSHEIVQRVNARLAEVSGLPISWAEPLMAIKYSEGSYFPHGHLDAHPHANQHTSTRVATCIVYLTDVPSDAGGETYFPLAERERPRRSTPAQLQKLRRQGCQPTVSGGARGLRGWQRARVGRCDAPRAPWGSRCQGAAAQGPRAAMVEPRA